MSEELELMETEVAKRPDYEGEIMAIVRSQSSPKVMQEKLGDYHENDIAEVLPKLSSSERVKLYRVLGTEVLSAVFEYTEDEDTKRFLDEMDIKKAADIVSNLETDTAAQLLKGIEKERRTLIISSMEPEARREVEMIAAYDEDEIGSRMTANFIVIRENLTVKQAMSSLIEQAAENDNIATIFVEDEKGEYYGAIDLKELIIARQSTPLENLVVTSFPYVYGHEDIDSCIERLKDYSEAYIPVLNNMNHIQGVITAQNIIEVVDDEMGEDYARLAGLTAEEDLAEPLTQSMRKRLPWLLVLLGLGMLVSSVVGAFEKVVSQLTLIIAFQSLILDMAGNGGTQSLAVTIRVLMDENLTRRQKVGLVFKEMRIGLCNGAILGGISFALLGLYIMLFKSKSLTFAYSVSACIGISIIVAMVIASIVGTVIPLFFKKIKIDPAVASGPLITTINDLVAVVTYYGMSWLLLIEVMKLAG